MELYLLRHGIAEDGAPGQPDSDRELTAEGRKKLKSVLKVAAEAGVAPQLIITSPLKRALQTAEIAAEALGYQGQIMRSDSLVPDSRPETVWEELRLHGDARQVVLTGHEPLFSAMTAYLLNTPELRFEFKKGAIVRIDLLSFGGRPHGILQWILTPKLAR
jgi:phosphohistidine phosphatase